MQQMVDPDIVPEGTPSPEDLYKEALRLDPMHLGSRLALAGIYSEKKDKKNKELVLEGGENFMYNSPLAMQYYQVLATSYLEGGNYVKAKETMTKAVEFKQRSDYSRARLNTTIPEAIANDGKNTDSVEPAAPEQSFPQTPAEPAETSGKKDSGL
jgi:tetratricopeptide (TPR) repeat protein